MGNSEGGGVILQKDKSTSQEESGHWLLEVFTGRKVD